VTLPKSKGDSAFWAKLNRNAMSRVGGLRADAVVQATVRVESELPSRWRGWNDGVRSSLKRCASQGILDRGWVDTLHDLLDLRNEYAHSGCYPSPGQASAVVQHFEKLCQIASIRCHYCPSPWVTRCSGCDVRACDGCRAKRIGFVCDGDCEQWNCSDDDEHRSGSRACSGCSRQFCSACLGTSARVFSRHILVEIELLGRKITSPETEVLVACARCSHCVPVPGSGFVEGVA
jgi:hypothetical protein